MFDAACNKFPTKKKKKIEVNVEVVVGVEKHVGLRERN